MRVLWFTNDPMPAVHHRKGQAAAGSGHWMSTLLQNLRNTPDLEIQVATVYPGVQDDQFDKDGITYFVVGQPKIPHIFFQSRTKDLEACVGLVRTCSPDLVHIHGTERFYGLLAARNLIDTPCVLSLQGFPGACREVFFGRLSPLEIWHSQRLVELATGRGLVWFYRRYAHAVRREQEILSKGRFFMGRTAWDRAYLKARNPTANYHHVSEVLRPSFNKCSWDLSQCERHSVIFTNSGEPLRGTETLIRAMLILRRTFPDVTLKLAGNIGTGRGYDRFLRRMIAESDLEANVELLGYLDADAMARELCRAHVFAIASYVENSPNSLCEAMQVGLPCVASYVGGIPSLIEQGRTGVLFPAGDAPLLADAIWGIFEDDELARHLGKSARAIASERHVPKEVVSQLLSAYRHVIGDVKESYDAETVAHT